MAGSLSKLVSRMRYWCDEGNLGYDQNQRWNIYEGGECDCSSLVYWCLWEAGFLPEKPTWGNTATLSAELTKRGWKRVLNDGSPHVGDILLNDKSHVAVCIAPGILSQASIDERGKIAGGQTGDQTGRETNTRSYYNYPWNCYLRYMGDAGNSPSTSTGGEKVYNFGYVNKKSSTGNHVKVCQAALNVRNGAGLVVDGSCGPKTVAAIKAWQQSHGLEVDGSCGPVTWQSLLAA